ncbi:MAG: WecB/TagA/CpsF family glycosyltransferase [Waddliaceae bacterium]
MQPRTFSLLGIPVENLNSAEAVEKILTLISQYRKEHPYGDIVTTTGLTPDYISTMNVNFLANTHGWRWRSIRHLELLDILRKSTIATPDGMPIVWLSKCLGNPLKERVTGSDLIPLLTEMLGEKERSIYLLGGKEKVAKQAAELLKQLNPGLKIAGIACPPIHVEGERLVETQQRDALLLEDINKASPDVLLVSLGHPKQEIWFERIRKHLHVPVAIGIGGTLDLITGNIKRAPRWMQSIGLEWLYRLIQEPKRLIKRYLFDGVLFLYLTIPLILFHRLNELFINLFKGNHTKKVQRSLLFLSQYNSIAIVRLPEIFCSRNAQTLNKYLDEAFAQDVVILDFHKTRHLDLEGLGLLVNTWKRAHRENKEIFGFGIKRNVRLLMRLHKVWNLLSNSICSTPLEVVSRLTHYDNRSGLYEAIQQMGETLTLSFFGKLNNTQNFDIYLQKLLPMIHQKDCIVDFTYCDFIDNAGFCFLLQLKQLVEGNGKTLKVKGLTKKLSRQFRLAKVDKLFEPALP